MKDQISIKSIQIDSKLTVHSFFVEQATALFAANLRWIPVEHVVKQLEPEPKLQLRYLHQLFLDKKGDEIKQFYDLQITLYAEYVLFLVNQNQLLKKRLLLTLRAS